MAQRREKVVTWKIDETNNAKTSSAEAGNHRVAPMSPKQNSEVSASDVIVERDLSFEDERKAAKKGLSEIEFPVVSRC